MSPRQATEHGELAVVRIDAGRVTEYRTCCRICRRPLALVWHDEGLGRRGYRVVRPSSSVTPRSPFVLGMASLTACPSRGCGQQFPELISPDQLAEHFAQ
jgi:hypothetical protein